jgi:hypothetical protein
LEKNVTKFILKYIYIKNKQIAPRGVIIVPKEVIFFEVVYANFGKNITKFILKYLTPRSIKPNNL